MQFATEIKSLWYSDFMAHLLPEDIDVSNADLLRIIGTTSKITPCAACRPSMALTHAIPNDISTARRPPSMRVYYTYTLSLYSREALASSWMGLLFILVRSVSDAKVLVESRLDT